MPETNSMALLGASSPIPAMAARGPFAAPPTSPPVQPAMTSEGPSLESFGYVGSRTLQRLIGYWLERRGERRMPALADIDPIGMPWALARIWLCDRLTDSDRFRFRLAGEKINTFWGQSIAGKYLDEIVPPERIQPATEKLRMVCQLPAIVHDRVCLTLTDEIARDGERIILPLSSDGVSVDALLGADECDWLHDLEYDPYATCSESSTVTAL